MRISIDQMKKLGWASITQKSIDELNTGIINFKVASANELCHFLSQVSHECGCGKWPTEIWGPTKAQLTYEGRAGLGNNKPGDGFKFRGAGYIQMTGRVNYAAFSKHMKDSKIIDIGADWVSTNYCWLSAFYWWMNNSMSNLCSTNPSVSEVTKRVNGGQNGLAEREAFYAKCRNIFTEATVNPPAPVPAPKPVTPTIASKKITLPILGLTSKTNDANAVKTLQKALNSRGFNCGTPDGIFGAATDKAVRSFQITKKLLVNGVVGPTTWAALGL